jgi:putative transposase
LCAPTCTQPGHAWPKEGACPEAGPLPQRLEHPAPATPPQATRLDKTLHKERYRIERFFNKHNQFRRVATRYDKQLANFRGFVQLASISILLASIVTTA